MPEINQHGQIVNDIVPDWKGAQLLTRTPLSGRFCRLEPLDATLHAADLFDAYSMGDDSDWTWLASTQPENVEATAHWIIGKVMDDGLVPYAVIDVNSERAVGLVSYMAIERMMGSVEIGHVTWSRKMKNTAMGTEAVWLLLKKGVTATATCFLLLMPNGRNVMRNFARGWRRRILTQKGGR